MGAYKKLNKQDAYITTYNAHKSWAVTGSDFVSYGIVGAVAGTGYTLQNLQQLYYKGKSSDYTIPSHSFDLYNQTTLFYSSSRILTTGSAAVSIPRQMYGTAIKPGTFKLSYIDVQRNIGPIDSDFVVNGFVEIAPTLYLTSRDGDIVIGPPPPPNWTITNTRYTFLDDAEGNIYVSGSSIADKVGDIIYTHGMVIVTDSRYSFFVRKAADPTTVQNVTMSFQNTQPIFTHNYHCKIRESEYNFTYNPSALTSSLKTVYDNDGNLYSTASKVSNGALNNNVTGSTFQPYITTVGLYNDVNQLIAVGKTTRPIPKPANTEMTIIVKIDI